MKTLSQIQAEAKEAYLDKFRCDHHPAQGCGGECREIGLDFLDKAIEMACRSAFKETRQIKLGIGGRRYGEAKKRNEAFNNAILEKEKKQRQFLGDERRWDDSIDGTFTPGLVKQTLDDIRQGE